MKYWAVNTKYFDNGHVKVTIRPIEAEKRPEDIMKENKTYDEYEDYFELYEEASKAYQDAKKA